MELAAELDASVRPINKNNPGCWPEADIIDARDVKISKLLNPIECEHQISRIPKKWKIDEICHDTSSSGLVTNMIMWKHTCPDAFLCTFKFPLFMPVRLRI